MKQELETQLTELKIKLDNFKEQRDTELKLFTQAFPSLKGFYYEYNEKRNMIEFYSRNCSNFDFYFEANFKYTYVSGEIRIAPTINIQNCNKLNHQESFVQFQELTTYVAELQNAVYVFNKEYVITRFKSLKDLTKKINKAENEISELKKEIELLDNQREFGILQKVLPKLGSFCIDSFLCDHFGIEYDNFPNNTQIRAYKEKIKNLSKTLRIPFFVYTQEANLQVSFRKTFLNVTPNLNMSVDGFNARTKKKINEALSNRFSFENEIITMTNLFDYELFNKIFDRNSSWKLQCGYTIALEALEDKLARLALKEDLKNF